jgi:endonuclease/exonuclease/phosphatase family metal-dependent hydrolase
VSQNVRLFGWYNWRTNQKDRDVMIKTLQGEGADIYCFQEFFSHRKAGVFDTKSILRRKLDAPYVHEVYPVTVQGDQQYGTAIFSKYPIIKRGQINFEGERSNLCLFADIVKDGDTLRVYSAHVASIRFSDADYQLIEDLNEDRTKVVEGKRIVHRLKEAYRKRALQVEKIVAHTATSPYKVIVCGDFNDTPVSYSYAHLTQNLQDSFREAGWGIGNTYRGKFPSFRIDYILHSESMACADYKTLPEQVSDHHAISSRMVWD